MNKIVAHCAEYKFTSHAVQRMFERAFFKDDILQALKNGEIIIEYEDDKPFPSYLVFSMIKNRPVHVLVALDIGSQLCYIITVYEPDTKIWCNDFKTRRKL